MHMQCFEIGLREFLNKMEMSDEHRNLIFDSMLIVQDDYLHHVQTENEFDQEIAKHLLLTEIVQCYDHCTGFMQTIRRENYLSRNMSLNKSMSGTMSGVYDNTEEAMIIKEYQDAAIFLHTATDDEIMDENSENDNLT